MTAIFKILLAFIFTFYILHFTFLNPAFAQTPLPFGTEQAASPSALPTSNLQPQYPASNLPLPTSISPTSPIYTDLLVHNLFHSFSCLAVGQSVIGQPCLTYQVTRNAQGMLQGIPVLSSINSSGGTLGAVTSLIGAMYRNPPVRTADYLASVGKDLGIVKEAHAQGVGGSGELVLRPILRLWQVSRNIAYVILIIIFLVIGLMVMFRNKINPQTVISAQTALPGLVIGLILITFSYFFAGLISDMAFVGTNVVGYYFSAVRGDASKPDNLVEKIGQQNALSILTPFTRIASSSRVADLLGSIWNDLAAPSTSRIAPWDMDPQKLITSIGAIMLTQLLLPFGNLAGGPGQIAAAVIALGAVSLYPVQVFGMLLSLLAMIMLLLAMFKLLLRLINNFITIIVLTITAPFQFLAAALPGRQGIATSWILNMLANILAFPAVLAVLYFVAFLIGSADPKVLKDNCADPCPFTITKTTQINNSGIISTAHAADPVVNITDHATFPLFGGFELSLLNMLLAFGALLALPSIPDIIGRTIGRLGVAGQLIGQEISGTTGAGQRYAGQFNQVGGLVGRVDRLTSKVGYQPTTDLATGKTTWTENPLTSTPGVTVKVQKYFGAPNRFWKRGPFKPRGPATGGTTA